MPLYDVGHSSTERTSPSANGTATASSSLREEGGRKFQELTSLRAALGKSEAQTEASLLRKELVKQLAECASLLTTLWQIEERESNKQQQLAEVADANIALNHQLADCASLQNDLSRLEAETESSSLHEEVGKQLAECASLITTLWQIEVAFRAQLLKLLVEAETEASALREKVGRQFQELTSLRAALGKSEARGHAVLALPERLPLPSHDRPVPDARSGTARCHASDGVGCGSCGLCVPHGGLIRTSGPAPCTSLIRTSGPAPCTSLIRTSGPAPCPSLIRASGPAPCPRSAAAGVWVPQRASRSAP